MGGSHQSQRPRLLVHVQHLLGTGHLRRALAVGRACADSGFEVLLLSGGPPPPNSELLAPAAHFEVVQLPPGRSADGVYSGLVDAADKPVDEAWRAARTRLVLEAFERFAPDIVMVETWPFGRRLIEFEVLPLLAAARAIGAATACSIRDIVEPRAKARRMTEMAQRASELDAVIVHGEEAVVPFDNAFTSGADDVDLFRDRLHYTGYVALGAAPRWSEQIERKNLVLVSVGGGALGLHLRRAVVEAAALDAAQGNSRPWRLYTGQNLPEGEFERLCDHAPGKLQVAHHTTELVSLMRGCAVSVSQAGYNTCVEVLQTRCPALLVPYDEHGEMEQVLRAKAFSDAGFAHTLELDAARDPHALLAAIDGARDAGPPSRAALVDVALDGDLGAARALLSLARIRGM